jgi:hypothetical protein
VQYPHEVSHLVKLDMYAYTKQSNCRQGTVAHPLEVFKYAVKHDYLDLGDEAVIGTISLSLDEVKLGLQDRPDILFAWVRSFVPFSNQSYVNNS